LFCFLTAPLFFTRTTTTAPIFLFSFPFGPSLQRHIVQSTGDYFRSDPSQEINLGKKGQSEIKNTQKSTPPSESINNSGPSTNKKQQIEKKGEKQKRWTFND